nr:cell fusion protein cfr1 [Quercus suber]
MLVSLTVGKVDAGVAVLLTEDKRLIEFPSILLPPDIHSGSIVDINVSHNSQAELVADQTFATLQDEIFNTFGNASPTAPVLRCRNATQTSVVLEWDPINLATAELRSLSLYRNGTKAGVIPRDKLSTKISGLALDTEYTFHLVLRTSAGQYSSEKLTVRTHKMTDLTGITITPGFMPSRNATQTSVVLEWDPINLATAELRSLSLYRNGTKAGVIPRDKLSTKISGLALDTEYTFHLVLRTSAGQYSSEKLTVRTHKMTDLTGITITPGFMPSPLKDSLAETVQKIGAKMIDTVRIDTTHFVCTERRGQAWEKAVELNVPVVVPDWLKGCEREGRLVGVRAYYLDANPKDRQMGPLSTQQGAGTQGSSQSRDSPRIEHTPPTPDTATHESNLSATNAATVQARNGQPGTTSAAEPAVATSLAERPKAVEEEEDDDDGDEDEDDEDADDEEATTEKAQSAHNTTSNSASGEKSEQGTGDVAGEEGKFDEVAL